MAIGSSSNCDDIPSTLLLFDAASDLTTTCQFATWTITSSSFQDMNRRTLLTKSRWIVGEVWLVPSLNSSQDTTRVCMTQLLLIMCRVLALCVVCVALSVQMLVENATRPLSMKCLHTMTCSFKTPLSNQTIVLRLTVCQDCNKSSTSSGVLLAKPMSRAVWMTFLKPTLSTDENGRMSHEHMLTRALVMLALVESVGMPRLFAQMAKLFEEEVIAAAHKQVWPLIDNVSSRELYM